MALYGAAAHQERKGVGRGKAQGQSSVTLCLAGVCPRNPPPPHRCPSPSSAFRVNQQSVVFPTTSFVLYNILKARTLKNQLFMFES